MTASLTPERLARVIAETWPPERVETIGPFAMAHGGGGGNRVSAARLLNAGASGSEVSRDEIDSVAAAQRALGQEALFMVLGHQTGLDGLLEAEGYTTRDETVALTVAAADLAAPPPRVTCFDIWPPLAVQEEIWAQGGIGPARLAIMNRVTGPKTSLFGRIGDRPAGSAFIAIEDGVAMLHALEVAPRARRQGLAAHMMRAVAHWAEAQGAEIFAVLVTRKNSPALGLYTSLGMNPVGKYYYRVKLGETAQK
ncbi:Histone acetyltransferase HPA2 [Roseibacterium elongatum DSM 19469]|uniref:Histone acetyltransferase HPA2 n=1 Tax=Roseicyclus elongatus DSM 19469 TaxID=1294273 RepID=W8RZT7_9RHOB|nr:GNAT family N-acetyltransferase [Roseibacterium elongatum]AHM03377.1 Histone acetyltransferase HPA2 [Roseibacterium elongatum DSM 19469]